MYYTDALSWRTGWMIVYKNSFNSEFVDRHPKSIRWNNIYPVAGAQAEKFYEKYFISIIQANDSEMFLRPAYFVFTQQNLLYDFIDIPCIKTFYSFDIRSFIRK